MADNVTANPGTGGAVFASDDISGVQYPRVKIAWGVDGAAVDLSATDPLPVATHAVTQSGTWNVGITGSVPVTGTFWQATQPVSAASLPLPTGAATEATLASVLTTTAFNARTPALGQAAMSASSPVVIASDQSTLAVNQAGVSATGSLTGSGQNVTLSLTGASGWAVDLRGTFTATVTFEGTVDGTNFFTIAVIPAGGAPSVATVTTATAVGAWWGNANGCQQVRARCSAYTSGTVTVVLRAMQAAGVASVLVTGATTTPVSGTVTANIGTGSIAAGTNAIGDVGVQYRANATGAASRQHLVSAASTNATVVKASAGRLLGWSLINTTASIVYVKLHNQTTSPTAGTGVVQTIALPANGLSNLELPGGIAFTTGIALTTVTGAADSDTTAVGANAIVGDLFFA